MYCQTDLVPDSLTQVALILVSVNALWSISEWSERKLCECLPQEHDTMSLAMARIMRPCALHVEF